MEIQFILIACGILYFATGVQALKCHECFYTVGDSTSEELADESCNTGSSPDNSFLKTCRPASDNRLETACTKIHLRGTATDNALSAHAEDIEWISRECMDLPKDFPDGCTDWKKDDIEHSTDIPAWIRRNIIDYYSSISILRICKCHEDGCDNEGGYT